MMFNLKDFEIQFKEIMQLKIVIDFIISIITFIIMLFKPIVKKKYNLNLNENQIIIMYYNIITFVNINLDHNLN